MKKYWADCVNTIIRKRNADEAAELRKAVKNLDTINSKRKKQEDAEFKEVVKKTRYEKSLRSPLGDRVSQLPPSI
jgi:hypothetical protein